MATGLALYHRNLVPLTDLEFFQSHNGIGVLRVTVTMLFSQRHDNICKISLS
jgi:hypothetical protein